jgi:beta-galactosidase
MRRFVNFNENWLYAPQWLDYGAPDTAFSPISLPHSNQIFNHASNVDNEDYQFISTYRKHFKVNPPGPDAQVLLNFEGVMLASAIHLNGEQIAENLGGFQPFSIDLSPFLQEGDNTLTVYVDSRERVDIPPYGHLVDYLTFGGIYREASLTIVNRTHIEDVFVQTRDVLSAPKATCQVTLSAVEPGLTLQAALLNAEGEAIAKTHTQADSLQADLEFDDLPEVQLWSPDHPTLYTLRVTLHRDGKSIDSLDVRFGFRTAEFRPDGGFYLNGERLDLFGLNRHQSYPYIGAAAPARLQRLDADILKNDLACNIVRTSHYPQSRHFLDRCDEIGLLVFEEIAGWQHIGDEKWQGLALKDLQAMIRRDRNRPSVILWGVRVNESPDDDAFYERTNALAHQLDPTRQTGGVRCFLGSHLLEDVYTYNDFSNTVIDPPETPYLITEFAGHMFPTKIWDHEERLIDHALLHARIQEGQLANPQISGAIGWCAFDYATHKEFGSGDRVCYHGVMDIYRLPKWAAYFYQSQQSPDRKLVLQPATHWTMGDRSGGGNDPLTVFSNCDEVEAIIGENHLGRVKPDRETYPHLPHPPFTLPIPEKYSAWGQSEFYDLQLIGYLDGEPVAEHWVASNQLPTHLELSTDTDQLLADGRDMTRLIVRITDAYGNPLPYATSVIHFDLEGPAELIGENPFPLIGGKAALFIRSTQEPGQVRIVAHCAGLDDAEVQLTTQ